MKFTRTFVTLLALILCGSCARTLSVFKTEKDKRLKGIPFYAHKGEYEQQTKYLYQWKELTLQKQVVGESKVETVAKARVPKAEDLEDIFNSIAQLNINGKENEVESLKTKINQLHDSNILSNETILASKPEVIQNHWAVVTKIDYAQRYYVNSKIPWLGSSTVSQKLAANGSLSEVSGTTDSQIDDVIGTAVSIATPLATIRVAEIQAEASDLIVSEEGTNKLLAQLQNQVEFTSLESDLEKISSMLTSKSRFTLKVEEKGYLYTFTESHELKNDKGPPFTNISFSFKESNFKRENWPTASAGKVDDKSVIKVSGNIKLPEEKD